MFRRSYRRNFSSMDGIGPVIVYISAMLVYGICACIIPQIIPESVAYSTAEGIGFTDVNVVSRDWVFIQFTGCDKNGSVKFVVNGTNPAGKRQTF